MSKQDGAHATSSSDYQFCYIQSALNHAARIAICGNSKLYDAPQKQKRPIKHILLPLN
jgi:hypothetical protein